MRYLVHPTPKKPTVDTERDVWTWNGEGLDVFEECQEPWMAPKWKRRREQHEMEAGGGQRKRAKFTKLDLTALILERQLLTKAKLLEYVQDSGSASMQLFANQNQRKLKEFIDEAVEWGQAREAAKAERESDWELVCRFAAGKCKFGDKCISARSVFVLLCCASARTTNKKHTRL